MDLGHTLLPWASECVSDHCRVFCGTGRRKIILARLAPKQLPENETAANGRLMAASPELLTLVQIAADILGPVMSPDHPFFKRWETIKKKLEGPK